MASLVSVHTVTQSSQDLGPMPPAIALHFVLIGVLPRAGAAFTDSQTCSHLTGKNDHHFFDKPLEVGYLIHEVQHLLETESQESEINVMATSNQICIFPAFV